MVILVQSTPGIPPPQSGKFFYTDMQAGGLSSTFDDHGLHFSSMLVSNSTPAVPDNQFHISLNTQLYALTLVSSECSPAVCTVTTKYDK